jgi:transcriptional regulator with GAF, ATPase, and Fis domain
MERTMNVDENEFFRQATIRLCSSLHIDSALRLCFDYIKDFIPVSRMSLHLFDPARNVVHSIASISSEKGKEFGRLIPLPEEGRDERAFKWVSAEKVKIVNRPDADPDVRKVLEALGQCLDISIILLRLELEGNRVGSLAMMKEGTDRYTHEHAALLLMLHEPFAIAMANALEHQEVLKLKNMLADDNRYLHRQILELSGAEIIGADFGLSEVMKMVRQVAPLESPVILLGETGAGKELLANAIHYSSPRKDGPFIKVNCGAIPESLLDSELFGHEKGAFTGAIAQKRGRFERANEGTIFLDEIGELLPRAQVRLLHVLQNKEIERVGGTKSIPVNVRIVSATNRNLDEMIKSRQFREDLWFRLNVFPIMIPPLRQRKEDIPALMHHFIEEKTKELKLPLTPRVSPRAIKQLMDYDWPGNVRELENLVERALIRHRGGPLTFDNVVFPQQKRQGIPQAVNQEEAILKLDELNTLHIRRVLKLTKGKINGPGGAAELLGIHPNTLRKRMDKLGIPFGRKHH